MARSPQRHIWPSQLNLMAELAGLDLEARPADWAQAESTGESGSHISLCRFSAAV